MLMIPLIFASLIMTGLGIYTVVLLFQEPKPLASDYRFGIYAVAILLTIEGAIIGIHPAILDVLPSPGLIVFQVCFTALKLFVCTAVGIKLSRELNIRWSMFDDPSVKASWKSLSIVFGAVAVLVVYSYFFLNWQQPSLGVAFDLQDSNVESGFRERIVAALGVFEFAFLEEIMYRGCFTLVVYRVLTMQRHRYLTSVIIVTSLWTVAHALSLDPAWVKYVQIIPLGLLCAWLMHRYGIEHAILAHGVFNVVFAFVDLELAAAPN